MIMPPVVSNRPSPLAVAFTVGVASLMLIAALMRHRPSSDPPPDPQCNHDTLLSFVEFVERHTPSAVYMLGAGTLLGAMRTDPHGLLPWDDDTDVYMPSSDARRVVGVLGSTKGRLYVFAHRGFGVKLRLQGAGGCDLDIKVLAVADSPFRLFKYRWTDYWHEWKRQLLYQSVCMQCPPRS